MNFNDMRALAKRIDMQVTLLETKVAAPMSMMYYNNSSQGVKVLSMLKGMIEDVETKKKDIELKIQEENLRWSEMVEDYNIVAKFKADIVTHLNGVENTWSSCNPHYKPFISHGNSEPEESDCLNDLSIHDDRFDNSQIADQHECPCHFLRCLNDSLNNITMS